MLKRHPAISIASVETTGWPCVRPSPAGVTRRRTGWIAMPRRVGAPALTSTGWIANRYSPDRAA
jgi:hypothetical protein